MLGVSFTIGGFSKEYTNIPPLWARRVSKILSLRSLISQLQLSAILSSRNRLMSALVNSLALMSIDGLSQNCSSISGSGLLEIKILSGFADSSSRYFKARKSLLLETRSHSSSPSRMIVVFEKILIACSISFLHVLMPKSSNR